jgi:5-methyltetrahydropteroyltriglutamate--homocysteine methyltransferase
MPSITRLSAFPRRGCAITCAGAAGTGRTPTTLPLEHIIDLILEVKAQTYSFEAGNVRHEHEWRVWQEAKLPAGKMLMPGVVSHAANLVEHPQLVADRILRYAAIVGRENVVAGTDCGLGGRVHADLARAKLRALVEGACLASRSSVLNYTCS